MLTIKLLGRTWEIEAHGRELGLFIRWAEKNKLGKRAWARDPRRSPNNIWSFLFLFCLLLEYLVL